jgi:serine/threonine protein kinase
MCVKGEQNLLLSDTTQLQNRYQLKSRLGANGGKQTWLAEDIDTHTEVTVKALYFGQGMEWQDLKLFEREAQTLKSLSHPRIPRYQDSFWLEKPEGNYFCLVQAYIPGVSLAQKVSSGWRLEEEETIRVATSILEILVYLHSQSPSVVHRDIKPNNLIWGEDDQIHLVDFGAVQAEVTPGRTMTVVGTYGYMPPEQFGGRTVPASDLYGLGTTLLFLLTGTNPAELPQKNFRIQFQDRIWAHPPLKRWLKRMIEPNLDDRFQHAEQALASLVNKSEVSSPSVVITLAAPTDSSVRVESTPESLDIDIPQGECASPVNDDFYTFSSIFLFILRGGIFIFFLILVLSDRSPWLKFIFCSISAISIIFSIFVLKYRTEIHINRRFYEITSSVLGIYLYEARGETLDIKDIKIEKHSRDYYCVLRCAEDDVGFGCKLSPSEQVWLIHEIQSWLEANR